MNAWRLITREIMHRKLNFALSLVAAGAAVFAFAGVVTLLAHFDAQTRSELAAYEAKVQARGKELEDAYRTITKGLDIVENVAKKGSDAANAKGDGHPKQEVDIKTLTMTAA